MRVEEKDKVNDYSFFLISQGMKDIRYMSGRNLKTGKLVHISHST